MALITLATVKLKWPTWQTLMDSIVFDGQTSDQLLQTAIDLAVDELTEFLDVEDADMTDTLTMHLMRIVQKKAFDMRHGDVVFKENEKPSIVVNYEDTMSRLKEGLIGPGSITMESRDRVMDVGVIDTDELWFE
jgi:hypothetical protein